MATRLHQDKYANVARQAVTLSAANTETFAELITGISLGMGIGMLIDQIDYYINQSHIEKLLAAGDSLTMGWTTSSATGALGIDKSTTLHLMSISTGLIIGTPASGSVTHKQPEIFQFFPPIIIATPRLFLGGVSASLASAIGFNSRIYFRYIDLSTREYLELAEAFVLIG